eukprot:GAHX01001978.1.p1 GENE.GAHX01001978.1~~GAHX01001978.1.p1  ORF type:complete len:68 (-),score=9.44 GAHX01001978.1:61-264(-)
MESTQSFFHLYVKYMYFWLKSTIEKEREIKKQGLNIGKSVIVKQYRSIVKLQQEENTIYELKLDEDY